MSRLALSNLEVRSNLLDFDDYQRAIGGCTVLEYKDAQRRLPNLFATVPPALQAEWRGVLFWGGRLPDPVDPRWADRYASDLAKAVPALERQSTEEAVLEALLLARQVYAGQPDDALRELAADWDRRLRDILEREFRLTDDMAERRLESVLGRVLPGPERRPKAPPPATERVGTTSPPPVTALRKRRVPDRSGAAVVDAPPAPAAPPPAPVAPPVALVVPPAAPDPDLERLTRAWPGLPDHVKKCLLLLVDAARTAPRE